MLNESWNLTKALVFIRPDPRAWEWMPWNTEELVANLFRVRVGDWEILDIPPGDLERNPQILAQTAEELAELTMGKLPNGWEACTEIVHA